MFGIWRRASGRPHTTRNAFRPFGFEPMEGRFLLSTIAAPLPRNPESPRVLAVEARKEHRQEVAAAARAKREAAYQKQYEAALSSAPSVGQGVSFTYNTLREVHKLVHSPNLQNAGLNFLKLSVSHDTTKVGAAYLDDFVKGNWNQLSDLGNTQVVKNVGKEFTALSHSPDVKKISRGFTHFGDAVAKQFNHLFGL